MGSEEIDLRRDDRGRLALRLGEVEHVPVEPVRAFPFTDPRHGIAICDRQGRELLWIEDLDAMGAAIRELLEEELNQREFVPVVQRVLAVSLVEPSEWEVETDHGPTRFVLNSADDVHRLDGMRALVTDAHGVRYLIPDLLRLDASSRRLLERFL